MRIISLLSLCLLLLNIEVFGQKVKTEKITIKQLHIPTTPLPENFKSFGIEFISKTDIVPENKKINLNISGYEKVDYSNADIIIKIEILDSKTEEKVEMKVTRSTSSNMQKPITKASAIAKVDIEFTTTLVDREKKNLHTIEYSNYQDIKSNTYKSHEVDISGNSDSKIKSISKHATSQAVNAILNKIEFETQKYLDEHFSFYPENNAFKIATGSGKKYDYTDLNNALKEFKNAAKLYSEFNLNESIEKSFRRCAKIWEDALIENNLTRISEEIKLALFHNLSVVYYLLEDYDNALNWAEKEKQLGKEDTIHDKIVKRQQFKTR
jgi:hypothetical protein